MLDTDSLAGVGLLFSGLECACEAEDKDTNHSENNSNVLDHHSSDGTNSNVLDHSVSHISNAESEPDAEALNEQLFWATTFGHDTEQDSGSACPEDPVLTAQTSAPTSGIGQTREFFRKIASKLAPSCDTSLVDHPSDTSLTDASKPFSGSTPGEQQSESESFEARLSPEDLLLNSEANLLGKRKFSSATTGDGQADFNVVFCEAPQT